MKNISVEMKLGETTYKMVNEYKDIPIIELVKPMWKNRKKTNLIKWLMQKGNLTVKELSLYLDLSEGVLNSKITRGSFTFDEILIAAYAAGQSFIIMDDCTSESYRIDPIDWFSGYEDKVKEHIQKQRTESYLKKKAELEAQLAELAELKEKYGIKD